MRVIDLKIIGNIELLKYFLSLHYKLFEFYENKFQDDPRAYAYLEILRNIWNHIIKYFM